MIDWAKFNLAKQSFKTCETDGEEGLTWDEVDSCEVSPIIFLNNVLLDTNWECFQLNFKLTPNCVK